MKLRISNLTKNSLLTTHASLADTPQARLRGLLDHAPGEFSPGDGLLFQEADAVHTVGMQFPIDILFIDMVKRRVQKVVQNGEVNCHFNTIRIPEKLCAVLELPAGVIALTGTEPGDVISIMSAGHCSEEEMSGISSFWPQSA